MKKILLLCSIMALIAVFFTSCKDWLNDPELPKGIWDDKIEINPDTVPEYLPGDTVYLNGDTVFVPYYVYDTIRMTIHDTINGVVYVHDTVYIVPVPAETLGFLRTSNQRNYGYYADDEQTTTMFIDGETYASTQVNYGAEVSEHGIDTMWLENRSKVTYNSPIIANARRAAVDRSDRRYNTFEGDISVTSQDVYLAMDDNFNSEVAELYEDASVTYKEVKRNLLYTRVVDTRYISHEDELVENDTVVKDGYVWQRKHRLARIQVKRVEYPQVGEEKTLYDTLLVDSRDAKFSTPLYVKDHKYVEPDTVTPEPTDTVVPEPQPEPGYKDGLIIGAKFTYAIDMSGRIRDALLLETKNGTLIPVTDENYVMVNGVRYVYNPAEVTVSDDVTAYDGVSYHKGTIVPAVVNYVGGAITWTYNGIPVCGYESTSLASAARTQNSTLQEVPLTKLDREAGIKNVGTTTHIQTPHYTVVISE